MKVAWPQSEQIDSFYHRMPPTNSLFSLRSDSREGIWQRKEVAQEEENGEGIRDGIPSIFTFHLYLLPLYNPIPLISEFGDYKEKKEMASSLFTISHIQTSETKWWSEEEWGRWHDVERSDQPSLGFVHIFLHFLFPFPRLLQSVNGQVVGNGD